MPKEWVISESDLGCDGAYLSYNEIVRCKNCMCYNTETKICMGRGGLWEADDFCSKGKPIDTSTDT